MSQVLRTKLQLLVCVATPSHPSICEPPAGPKWKICLGKMGEVCLFTKWREDWNCIKNYFCIMKSLTEHKILSLKKIAFLQLNISYSKCETTSYTSSNFRTKVPSSLPKIRFWAAVLKKSSSFQVSSSSQLQKYLFDWFGAGQKRSCRFTQLICGWLSMAPSRDWLSLSVWLWAHSGRS